MTTRCHSVRSRRSPEVRSRQLSEVARFRLAMRVPSLVERISGSRPRLPTRMTLLTLPAMGSLSNPFGSCRFAVYGRGPHLIKPGGCSYFILIPAIHRLAGRIPIAAAPGRTPSYREGHKGCAKDAKASERLSRRRDVCVAIETFALTDCFSCELGSSGGASRKAGRGAVRSEHAVDPHPRRAGT